MRILKNIVLFLLNVALINLVIALVININLKTLITNDVLKEVIKEKTTEEIVNSEIELPEENQEMINEVLDTEEAEEMINNYFDITISSMIDNKNLENVDIEKELLTFIESNRSLLEAKFGKEKVDELVALVKEKQESKEFTHIYKETITNSSKALPEEAKILLQVYNYLTSIEFRNLLFILIAVDLLLIILVNREVKKIISNLGISTITSGIGLVLMGIIFKMILTTIAGLTNVSSSPFINVGIILLVVGIITIIINKIIFAKKGEDHEVSKLSNS